MPKLYSVMCYSRKVINSLNKTRKYITRFSKLVGFEMVRAIVSARKLSRCENVRDGGTEGAPTPRHAAHTPASALSSVTASRTPNKQLITRLTSSA